MNTEDNMQTLFLVEELFELIDCGKTVTIRKGRRDIQLGELKFLSPVDGDEHPMKRIVDVTHLMYCKAKDIPMDLLQDDGFDDHDDMIKQLQRFYPGLDEETECTAILFENK